MSPLKKTTLYLFAVLWLLSHETAVLRAQVTQVPGGYVVHRKALTISEIHARRLAKAYQNPVTGMLQLPKSPLKTVWVPQIRRDFELAIIQAQHLQTMMRNLDAATLQIGTLMGGSHGLASVIALLAKEPVREFLDIDRERGAVLDRIAADYREQVAIQTVRFRRENPETTPEASALQALAASEIASSTLQEPLHRLLKPQELQHAKELVFMLHGGFQSPVVDLEILAIFDLNKEQREKLELIAEDANKKRADLLAGKSLANLHASDMETIHGRLQTIAELNARKIREVLMPEQKKLAENLDKQWEVLLKELQKRGGKY